MKKSIFLILLTLCSCGKQGPSGPPGYSIQGEKGENGSQGYGAGIKVSVEPSGPNCSNGGIEVQNYQDLNNNNQLDNNELLTGLTYVCNGSPGSNGNNGINGTNGLNGNNGSNGVSSTFNIVVDSGLHCSNGGFDVTFTDINHSVTEYVCNGVNGQTGNANTNGNNGSNGGTVSFNLVQVIEPCGALSSPWKETLLGLSGGQLLASFSETAGGLNTRFSFIPNGTYQDTDSSGCVFTVTGDGSTYSDIHWNSGHNSYSTWTANGYHWTQANGWVLY